MLLLLFFELLLFMQLLLILGEDGGFEMGEVTVGELNFFTNVNRGGTVARVVVVCCCCVKLGEKCCCCCRWSNVAIVVVMFDQGVRGDPRGHSFHIVVHHCCWLDQKRNGVVVVALFCSFC